MTVVWAIVPARSGSKGVADKNIRPLGGHPLLAWSVRAGLKSRLIERVIVSTDSQKYGDIAVAYGGEVPFLRPLELAGDLAGDIGFMKHAIDWADGQAGGTPDLWVLLRPTTPLRESAVIDQAVESLLDRPKTTSLRTVHEMAESAYKTFEMTDGRLKQVGTGSYGLDAGNAARQTFAKTYAANGYADVLRTALIRENDLMLGDRVTGFETGPVVEVDSEAEFELLEFQLSRRPGMVQHLFDDQGA